MRGLQGIRSQQGPWAVSNRHHKPLEKIQERINLKIHIAFRSNASGHKSIPVLNAPARMVVGLLSR